MDPADLEDWRRRNPLQRLAIPGDNGGSKAPAHLDSARAVLREQSRPDAPDDLLLAVASGSA